MTAAGKGRWWLASLSLVLLLGGCRGSSDGGEATSGGARTPVPGFGEITFRIDDGPTLHALLADSSDQHSKGLMGRTDLAGYDGMLFRFARETTGPFYMLNTPMPLSIAWFDAQGRFVSATDMEPCLNTTDCPNYAASGPYRYALEVPKGNLPKLGIGPGARLEFGTSP